MTLCRDGRTRVVAQTCTRQLWIRSRMHCEILASNTRNHIMLGLYYRHMVVWSMLEISVQSVLEWGECHAEKCEMSLEIETRNLCFARRIECSILPQLPHRDLDLLVQYPSTTWLVDFAICSHHFRCICYAVYLYIARLTLLSYLMRYDW